MTEQEQGPNNRLALSNTEMEKESETHIKSGRPQSGVWKHFDRGESRGDGHWEGTCKYCKKFYPRAKPNALRAHLANNCKDIPEEWRRHFNYILINNLNDVPTDKPLTGESVITQDWKKVEKLVANQPEMDASLIDEAISLAFIMCGIPFRVINNPFFINALKILNPNYIAPSRKTLSGRLLDNEVAKVNNKIDEVLEFTNNLTIGLDGWTAPDGSSIWNFIVLTSTREEYLYELGNYSNQSHTAEFLANQIESVINRIGSKKIIAIVSDNGANVASARRLICSKYKKILNIRCIAHCYNLISKDIILHTFAERMIQRANRIIQFFKKSHKAAAILKEKIKQHEISGGGLKTYVETRWTTVHECVSSIVRLKNCLEDIRDNHSEVITTPAILTILHSRGFFSDMQHLSEVLFPIKNAILAVEAANSTLADAYVNLMKIAAVIQNLPADEYKGFRNHCIKKFNHRFEEFNDPAYQLAFFLHPAYKGAGLKFGAFSLIAIMLENYGKKWPNPYVAPYTIGSDTPLMWWNTCEVKPNYLQRLAIKLFSITPSSAACERMFSSLGWLYGKCRTRLEINKLEGLAKVYQFNLSTAAEKFHKTQTEISPETMKNIAETVFNEFEEEAFLEESENAELPNPAEHLYTNEQDLNLDISNMINFQSSIFNSNGNNNEHEESSDDESSDEDDEDDEYDVNEIVISIERMQCT
ncbi:unnamed protein product [Rhizophagus irregularis]|nr:unnamed protein product [Rhizophagus irregularis]